jgi:ribosome maturation factor RimP
MEEKIRALLEPVVEAADAFLVALEVHTDRGQKVIQAFVDTDAGITIEQCAHISRVFSRELMLANLIPGDYRLEISSPGLERPLRLLRQYHKNIGRRFRVKFMREGEQAMIVGALEKIEGNLLTFVEASGKIFAVPFESIIESKEELPW